ncbi:GyrI-like domain-containing protein, partial [Viridibacillus sp. YIM B01967]
MEYKIVERESFQVVGVKREFSLVNEENLKGVPGFWDEINGNGTDELLFKLNKGEITGVLGVCVDKRETQSEEKMDYWIATECDDNPSEGLSALEIPASKWGVFEVRGPMP